MSYNGGQTQLSRCNKKGAILYEFFEVSDKNQLHSAVEQSLNPTIRSPNKQN